MLEMYTGKNELRIIINEFIAWNIAYCGVLYHHSVHQEIMVCVPWTLGHVVCSIGDTCKRVDIKTLSVWELKRHSSQEQYRDIYIPTREIKVDTKIEVRQRKTRRWGSRRGIKAGKEVGVE